MGLGNKACRRKFLSIQAQDFIEDRVANMGNVGSNQFLSIQAQDFIEE